MGVVLWRGHSRGIASSLNLVKPLIKFLLHYTGVFPSHRKMELPHTCAQRILPSVSISA